MSKNMKITYINNRNAYVNDILPKILVWNEYISVNSGLALKA